MNFVPTPSLDSKLPTIAGLIAECPGAEIIKYSPKKRCIIRVRRQGRNFYAKVYPSKFLRRGRGEGIDEIGRAFWSLAEAGQLNFSVAKPAGWDAAAVAVWNEELVGSPAIERLRNGGEQVVHEIGKAIALIADSPITPNRIFGYAQQLEDTAESAEILFSKFPAIAPTVKSVLEMLETVDLPEQVLKPIHGDMHIDQWMTNGNELGLLDLEDVSLGHPERDLAFFGVQLESEHGTEVDYATLIAVLMGGYKSLGSWPNKRLMKIYSANKWFSKSSKASSIQLANELLRRAVDCLVPDGFVSRGAQRPGILAASMIR